MKTKAVAAGMGDLELEIAESEQTQPEVVNGPSLEEIRHRAYELYVERSCIHGRDQDDWLQAERELFDNHQAR